MARFAGFLRGINVAGRRVGGEQLCAALETVAGVAGADAFLASGNVVFDYSGRRRPASLAAALEAAIERKLGTGTQRTKNTIDRIANKYFA